MKEYIRLADFFNVEFVAGYTGWRAVEKASANKPLPLVDEMAQITPDDQPAFEKVEYKVEKRGDIVPVSSELLEDNTAGLMQYLANWFSKKVVLTENAYLLALMDALTAADLGTDVVKGLKRALNKGLNTAHSKRAAIIANQDAYTVLDEATDTNGRWLLVPDPTQPDVFRFKGRRVAMADNDLLPNGTDVAPLYIGDFQSYGTLFLRKAFEFASTDVGGNAWRTDSTEVRGIMRLDAKVMDSAAALKRTVAIPT